MTPNFLTGLALANPTAEPVHLIIEGTSYSANATSDMGFATITVGSLRQAQGPVLRRYRDGRITIDAGGRAVTGLPLKIDDRRSFWSRLSGRLS